MTGPGPIHVARDSERAIGLLNGHRGGKQPLLSTLAGAAGLLLLEAGSPAGSIPLSRDRAAVAQGRRWMLLESGPRDP